MLELESILNMASESLLLAIASYGAYNKIFSYMKIYDIAKVVKHIRGKRVSYQINRAKKFDYSFEKR